MASTKFYLDCRRAKPGQPSVLKIAIGHGNKTSYISLDARLLPNQWDSAKEKVKEHPDKQILNAYIYEMKQNVDAQIIFLTREQKLKSMSANDIRDFIMEELDPDRKKAKEDKTTFLYRFNQYASRMKPGSKRTFDHTLNRLTAYVGEVALKKLKFEDMTVDWLTGFDVFMARTAPSKNSRNIHFRNIRTVFNDAIEDSITSFYPFRRFKIKGEVTAKITLPRSYRYK